MNKILLAAVLAAGLVPMVNAQTSGVTTSTDPARIAAVERHARELRASQPQHSEMSSGHRHHGGKMAHDHHDGKGMHHHHGKPLANKDAK